MDKHCVGCIYYWRSSADWCMCDYFEQAGKLRPCKPGKDCTVKVVGKRKWNKKPLEIKPQKKG